MSLFVLDTDILSLVEKRHLVVCQQLSNRPFDIISISVISVEEQLRGWFNLVRKAKDQDQTAHAYQRLAECVPLLARFPILPLTKPSLQRYEFLKRQKLGVAGKDLRIAAIALEHGGIVVTRNLRDFGRVPGLVIEDWSV